VRKSARHDADPNAAPFTSAQISFLTAEILKALGRTQ
jgi:hypothetical protein